MWKPEKRAGKWVVVDPDRLYPRIMLGHDDTPLSFDTIEGAQAEADSLNKPEAKN